MNAVLISTYDSGRQPFSLGSAAAWLKRVGAAVTCVDLAVEQLCQDAFRQADLIALSLPMHTATRLATGLIEKSRRENPAAHICVFGLYAAINESYLRKLGAHSVLGGEFEAGLAALAERLMAERPMAGAGGNGGGPQREPLISLARQKFLPPERSLLPPLEKYAHLQTASGEQRTVGYVEASRGCKHLCRHCPVVPVYQGVFRVVQKEVVLEDLRRQVAAGARHISFGDPDFFNGPAHGLGIVEALHGEFPELTYDVTIKVEHLLRQRRHLPLLRDTGCLFVTSAVESVDNRVLELLAKGHTREDFAELVRLFRRIGLQLSPTFVTFTPWTTLEGYIELLETLSSLELIDQVAPVQYAIRLLITAGSKLLELAETRAIIKDFDEGELVYPWVHPDARVDRLFQQVSAALQEGQSLGESRREIFARIARLAYAARGDADGMRPACTAQGMLPPAVFVPYLTEPWYC
ncbi:MAG: CUAEP/CCAEP-tail radical SAM protein [SAR324 cluster bacterium]|nr:CUAEP/CCAEP-tail radical SAM protein [SAR324 cluster bacterium]